MSIQQVSNNRPSGSNAKSCDAGIPIVGRTSPTGTYEILKVNPDGSLAGAAITPVTSAGVPYSLAPTAYPLAPPALKAAGVIVYYDQFTSTALNAGLYRINPFYLVDTITAAPAVNIILVKKGSPLDAYCISRNVGIDGFTPAVTDFVGGYGVFWHNLLLETISTANLKGTANLNATEKIVQLEAGNYALLIYVHTAFTNATPTSYLGFTEFVQLA